MARINLLPWREELRRQRTRQFYAAMAGAALLTLAVVGYLHLRLAGQIEIQQTRNAFLTQQIAHLDAQIGEIRDLEKRKKELLARMAVIQALQAARPVSVHLFEEVARATPDGVQLLKMTQTGDVLRLEGIADANARVSALMRNLDASPWLSDPHLEVIDARTREYPGASWFALRVQVVGEEAG